MTVVKQYGPRRSGTNWLCSLIEEAWPEVAVLQHDPQPEGWKHQAFIPIQETEWGPVDCYTLQLKRPYSFLASAQRYYAQHEQRNKMFAYMLGEKWTNCARSYVEAVKQRDDCVLIRYEDMLDDPVGQLWRVADIAGLPAPDEDDIDIQDRQIVPCGDRHLEADEISGDPTTWNLRYYAEQWYYLERPIAEYRIFLSALEYTNGPTIPEGLGYGETRRLNTERLKVKRKQVERKAPDEWLTLLNEQRDN